VIGYKDSIGFAFYFLAFFWLNLQPVFLSAVLDELSLTSFVFQLASFPLVSLSISNVQLLTSS
jgi:hypothetical protein